MATVSLDNWDEKNTASVGTLSDGSSFTGLQKVQVIKVSEGTGSGTGDAQLSTSTWNNISANNDFVVTESDESTTRVYEIALLDTTGNVAWIWTYGSWNSDGSDQVVVAGGTGDGTDYSVDGTGGNPWAQTGINAELVALYNESNYPTDDASDSSGNGNSGSVTGASSTTSGQLASAISGDGSDDIVSFGNASNINSTNLGQSVTVAVWTKFQNLGQTAGDLYYVNHGGSGGNNDFDFWHDASGNFDFRLDTSSAQNVLSATSDSNVTQGEWVLTVGKYDGSTGTHALFNSSGTRFTDTSSQTGDLSGVGSATGWANLAEHDGSASSSRNNINADVDAFRIYSEHKSDNWEQAEYDASPQGGQVFFNWSGPTATGATQVTATDSLSFAEETSTRLEVTVEDTMGFAETVPTTLKDSLEDSLGFAEETQTTLKTELTDNLGFDEQLATKIITSIEDNLTFNEETIAVEGAVAVTATDSLSFGEEIDTTLKTELSDTLSFQEVLKTTIVEEVVDNLQFAENLQVAIVETLTDTLGFQEEVATTLVNQVEDTIGFQEVTETRIEDELEDNLGFQEVIETALQVSTIDTLDFAEDLETTLQASIEDQLGFDEEVSAAVALEIIDTLGFAEATTVVSLLTVDAPTRALITTKDKFAVMENHTFKEGDLADEMSAQLKDEDGVIDLSTAKKVKIRIKDRSGSNVLDADATIDDASNGKVTYSWSSNDPIDTAGIYRAEWVIVDQQDETETVPNDGFITIEIEETA